DGLEGSRSAGDSGWSAEMLQSLGVVAEEYPAARSLFEESLAIRRELGDRAEIGTTLNCLGRVTARQGDYAAACSLHEQGLAICRQSGAKDGIAQSLKGLADVARLRGDAGLALSVYNQS